MLQKNIVQLKDVDLSQFLEKSSVGTDGFGPDVASAAVSLEFLDPVPDDFGMIAHDHISGQTFVGVVVLVLDAFNQTVVGGINEAGVCLLCLSQLLYLNPAYRNPPWHIFLLVLTSPCCVDYEFHLNLIYRM